MYDSKRKLDIHYPDLERGNEFLYQVPVPGIYVATNITKRLAILLPNMPCALQATHCSSALSEASELSSNCMTDMIVYGLRLLSNLRIVVN